MNWGLAAVSTVWLATGLALVIFRRRLAAYHKNVQAWVEGYMQAREGAFHRINSAAISPGWILRVRPDCRSSWSCRPWNRDRRRVVRPAAVDGAILGKSADRIVPGLMEVPSLSGPDEVGRWLCPEFGGDLAADLQLPWFDEVTEPARSASQPDRPPDTRGNGGRDDVAAQSRRRPRTDGHQMMRQISSNRSDGMTASRLSESGVCPARRARASAFESIVGDSVVPETGSCRRHPLADITFVALT